MTDSIETIRYTENPEFKINLTPEDIASLPGDDRKALRTELYQYPEEGLKYEFIERLRKYRLLYFDLDSNKKGSKKYKGALQWNIEELDNLDIESKINVSQLKGILKPNKDVTYEQVEALFNGDPNFLVASMSLIANNYKSILLELDSEYMHNKDIKDIYFFRDDFLFTNSEEKIFLTGRTLLKELFENTPEIYNNYIQQLITDIDSIILRFNIALIGKYAKKYSYFIDNGGLMQEGEKGVLIALDKFDIDRGVKFSTYATWLIRLGIARYYQNNCSEIRIPVNVREAMTRFDNAQAILIKKCGKKPTFNETWEYCKKNSIDLPKKKEVFKMAMQYGSLLSLDKEFADSQNSKNDNNLYNYIKSPNPMDKSKKDIENKEYVNQLLNILSERERKIVKMRKGLIPNENKTDVIEHTLEEVGKVFGISRERVRQIENVALKKLKDADLKLRATNPK